MNEGEFDFGSVEAGTEFLGAELPSGLTKAKIAPDATDERKR